MKAVVQTNYGPADVLEVRDIDQPAIEDNDVLVRVRAASINPLDWHFMRARPFFMRFVGGLRTPKQPVRGVDVAGVVETVGSSVTSLQAGDEVFGWCEGAFAEYVRTAERSLVKKPAEISFEQAAGIPIAGFTALQGLRDLGRIEPGMHVLVIGASGGVGTFAVQIAKSFGAEVTGVCSTRNVELVRSLGADHVVDYTQEDVTMGDQRYDLAFQLAGTASPSKLRRILTSRGTLVLSSGEGRFSGVDRIIRAMTTSPFVSQRLVTWVAKNTHEDLTLLAELIGSGKVTPVIDRTYDLRDTAEAIRYVEDGHTRGKVVVTVSATPDRQEA